MTGIAATPDRLFAAYSDGSGVYLQHLNGRFLATVITDHTGEEGESFAHELTRDSEYDSRIDDEDVMRLADRFAWADDFGGHNAVAWIDGIAFVAEYASGEYVEYVNGSYTLADAIAWLANFEREETAFDESDDKTARGIIEHIRNTVAMPNNGGPGGYEMEYDETDSYNRYAVVLLATDDEITAALAELAERADHDTDGVRSARIDSALDAVLQNFAPTLGFDAYSATLTGAQRAQLGMIRYAIRHDPQFDASLIDTDPEVLSDDASDNIFAAAARYLDPAVADDSIIGAACGVVQPNSLGYQRCIYVKHETPEHRSQDGRRYTVTGA